MIEFEGSFKNKDAQNLVYRAFIPVNPRACVILVHGLGEHSLKYDYLAGVFCDNRIAFFSYDQRGHGRSDGERGRIKRFSDFVCDLRGFIEIVKVETSCDKVYLIGLSVGALTAFIYSILYDEDLKGLIVSSPALRLKNPPGAIERYIVRGLAVLFPWITTSNRIAFEALTHDEKMVAALKADKLYSKIISFRMFAEMIRAMKYVFENAEKIRVPVLLLHGRADSVTDPAATRELYDILKTDDKEIKLYPDLYHELFSETKRMDVLKDVFDWISKDIL